MQNNTSNNRMRCVTGRCFQKSFAVCFSLQMQDYHTFWKNLSYLWKCISSIFEIGPVFFLQYWNGVCFLLHYLFGQVNHKLRSFFRDVKPWNALIDSKHWHKGEKQTNKHLKIDKLSSCEVAEQLSVINKYSWTFRSDVLFIQDA